MYKQTEMEKRIRESMKSDGEFETLLDEIPYATSLNHLHHHHLCMSASPPVSKVCLQTEYSPSSSFSGGFCSSEDISPSPIPLEESTHQTPSIHYFNRMWMESKSPDYGVVKNANEYMLDDLGLSENLYRMKIRDEQKDCANIRQFPDGFGFSGRSFIPCNVEQYDPCEGLNNFVSDYGGFQPSIRGVPMSFDDDMESALLGLGQGYKAGNSMGSFVTHNQSNALYSDPSFYKNQMNYLLEQRKEQGNGYYRRGIQVQNPSINRPYLNEDLFCSQQSGIDCNGEKGVLNPLNSSQLMHSRLALNVENPLYNRSILKERTRAIPNSRVPQSLLSMKGARDLEAFSCEDSFIIQGKSLNYVINMGCDRLRGHQKSSCDEIATRNLQEKSLKPDIWSQYGGIYENGWSPISNCPLLLQPNYSSLAEVQGYIYFIAKDQQGCRFLQGIFDEGTCEDVRIIFNEIIDHVVELMVNPFGNYLMQKLLEVCNEEQRMKIVRMVTAVPGQLVRISLNTHGTRVVQKLVETLKTRQQISSVTWEVELGFLNLSKDLNGNHVVQRCLQCLNNEDNKFIFDAATKFCVDLATHRHGCCVLQKCITHSIGERREKLVVEISANGLLIAQDAFGNYVVQYIIELEMPSATANLISQFEGNYLHLSMQKFSSHVVQKCLSYFEESRSRIIRELMSVSHFEQLLQDPYANYVIQSALEVTKGPLHASLVEAIQSHTILRTSPYCKRIFSRNLLKK